MVRVVAEAFAYDLGAEPLVEAVGVGEFLAAHGDGVATGGRHQTLHGLGQRRQGRLGVGRHGEVIKDYVDKLGAGMVVLGTRGHTGLAGILLGSVAQDVIAHVSVPVTLIK